MAVVAAGRAMEDRTVVPHDERVRLPLVAIAEWLAALPLHQFVEEGQRLRIVHVFDADDVAGAAEQSLAAGFGVLADDRVRLRRQRFLARTDVHAAARIPRTVHARWRIAAARKSTRLNSSH